MRSKKRVGAIAALVAIAVVGCGGSDEGSKGSGTKPKGEIVITCEACPLRVTKDNTFDQYRKQLVDAFNAKYKGRYRVQPKPYRPANDADSAQHYQRAATTDTLPDLFSDQANVLRAVAKSGKLVDFAPALKQDTAWKDSFQGDAFLSLTDEGGHVWGMPEQRDVVGIFYNKALFKKAGIAKFPGSWSEALADCSRLKAAGVIPFAMDGDWVTQLIWSNLIGTKPGGPQFLTSGIANGGFAQNPTVVQATEFLKKLHTSGCVNKDAFTGDYNHAAAPFMGKQAAMIANGPWMVPDNTKAKVDQGYAIAPDNGLIVIPGSAGWASGAKGADRREAVTAFMKFMTSDDQMFRKAVTTGSYWPTKVTLTAEQIKQLEPLSYHLLQEADKVAHTYPHAKFATPQAFTTAWVNNLPAYVQGKMSTEDFLNALSDTVKR